MVVSLESGKRDRNKQIRIQRVRCLSRWRFQYDSARGAITRIWPFSLQPARIAWIVALTKRARGGELETGGEVCHHADFIPVLQILADPRKIDNRRDAVADQLLGRSDTGKLQELRCIECS